MSFKERLPLWKTAAVYLAAAGAFFFISYGLADKYTASLPFVPSIFYSWEKYIPFWPWTIIPYWSMDLFYAMSFFLCATKKELSVHTLRLISASAFCCLCFIIFPLACSAEIPPVSNSVFSFLFSGSGLVATPFNQAPSLHIALAWLVWLRFSAHTKGFFKAFAAVWFLLIGISVLTCKQHHFIDVPLGFAAGVFISYLLPMKTYKRNLAVRGSKRIKLMFFYFAGAAVFGAAALYLKGLSLFLLWPAAALGIVGLGYGIWGTAVFQKDEKGALSPSAKLLLAPYRLGSFLYRKYLLRKIAPITPLSDKIFLGSILCIKTIEQETLLDLTAEIDSSAIKNCRKIICPNMDLTPLTPRQIQTAISSLKEYEGSLLICCALGLSRSAAVAAALLVEKGKFSCVKEALSFIKEKRPIVISPKQVSYLSKWEQIYIIKNRV